MADWTKDAAEIPPSGDRQDMTLSKIGFPSNHLPSDDNPTKLVLRCVIDNGEYEGFRLSHSFLMDESTGRGKLEGFFNATDLLDKMQRDALNGEIDVPPKNQPRQVAETIKEQYAKDHRFSAIVEVEQIEKEDKRVAVYNLTDFDLPQEDASLYLQSKPRQFYRD